MTVTGLGFVTCDCGCLLEICDKRDSMMFRIDLHVKTRHPVPVTRGSYRLKRLRENISLRDRLFEAALHTAARKGVFLL